MRRKADLGATGLLLAFLPARPPQLTLVFLCTSSALGAVEWSAGLMGYREKSSAEVFSLCLPLSELVLPRAIGLDPPVWAPSAPQVTDPKADQCSLSLVVYAVGKGDPCEEEHHAKHFHHGPEYSYDAAHIDVSKYARS